MSHIIWRRYALPGANHLQQTRRHNIRKTGIRLRAKSAHVRSLAEELIICTRPEFAGRLPNHGRHAAFLLGKTRATRFVSENGVLFGVDLPFKREYFQVVHAVPYTIVRFAGEKVAHETSWFDLDRNRGLVGHFNDVQTRFGIVFVSTDGGFQSKLGHLDGKVVVCVLLASYEKSIHIKLSNIIANSHRSTLNLIPALFIDGANVDFKRFVSVHVITVDEEVTFAEELE